MTQTRRFSHVAGVDDAPFARAHRGAVGVIATIFSGVRLEGVLSARVRRDGADATRVLAALLGESKFAPQLQLVLLQGIALAGFNVVDLPALHAALGVPVLVVARRAPRLTLIRDALLTRVPGGARKWRLIERVGPMEPVAGVWVQRAGLTLVEAERVLRPLQLNGLVPEPLRTAHLIAGGVARGVSRGRA